MIEYESSAELNDMSSEVIASYPEFELIRDVTVAAVLKVKMNKDDEMVETTPKVGLKKVPDLYKALSAETDLVLVVDAFTWKNANDDLRRALVHTGLMGIEAKRNNSGEVTLKARTPDVVFHSATLRRFGDFDPSVESLRSILHEATTSSSQRIAAAAQQRPYQPRAVDDDDTVLTGEEQ